MGDQGKCFQLATLTCRLPSGPAPYGTEGLALKQLSKNVHGLLKSSLN